MQDIFFPHAEILEKNGCAHRSPDAHPLMSSHDSLERWAPHVLHAAPARTTPSAPLRTA
jgi:hypothetical protein